MSTELVIHAVHEGGMCVTADNGSATLTMDYPLPKGGELAGMTPLQALLASLAACSVNSLMIVLKGRMQQVISGLEVTARGLRREEHPTMITDIALEFVVHGNDVDPAAMAQAIQLAESHLCPVWAMLKPGVRITSSFRILETIA